MRIGSGVQSVSELFGKRQNNSKTSVNGNEAFPQTSMKVYLKTDDMLFSGGNGTGLSFYIKYAEESTDDNPVVRELNARSSGLKKYDVYEKAITRQRRELEKVNRKFSELYGDYSEHLINESEYLTLKQQYLLKSEALKKEIDNLLVSQNLYSKNYKIDEDWENLINKYLKCRKLNKELADAFVDKVQVFEDGRISVNLVYDDCLEELLQVKNKREGDLYE
mgnify:CR=1 FL=1